MDANSLVGIIAAIGIALILLILAIDRTVVMYRSLFLDAWLKSWKEMSVDSPSSSTKPAAENVYDNSTKPVSEAQTPAETKAERSPTLLSNWGQCMIFGCTREGWRCGSAACIDCCKRTHAQWYGHTFTHSRMVGDKSVPAPEGSGVPSHVRETFDQKTRTWVKNPNYKGTAFDADPVPVLGKMEEVFEADYQGDMRPLGKDHDALKHPAFAQEHQLKF